MTYIHGNPAGSAIALLAFGAAAPHRTWSGAKPVQTPRLTSAMGRASA